jgi:hypothetical protein
VEAKAKLANARAEAVRQKQDSENLALVLKHVGESPKIALLAPLVDQGITFFMAHHAIGLDQPSIASSEYNRYLSTDGFHPLISASMTALGLAGVANLYMDPALKQEATKWYLKAIKMANAAISSTTEARKDTTLVGVNLLTMFEATNNEETLSGWSHHVDGASLLIKVRGEDQIHSAAARRLYLHTVGLLTINCMGKGIPIPKYINRINEKMAKHLDRNDPRTAFFFLHLETANLRAHILNDEPVDLEEIIDRALELDTTAAAIFENVPHDWRYDTVPCFEGVPGVFGHYYHVYHTHSAAQTWNWVRYNRIYFHDIIRNCILAGFANSPPTLTGARYAELLGSSAQKLQQLQGDIIASMPQFLHDTPMTTPRNFGQSLASTPVFATPPPSPPRAEPMGDTKRFFQNFENEMIDLPHDLLNKKSSVDRIPLVRVSGGYSTVWALYVAGSMPTASAESQDFVLHCFDRIDREFGIKQARVFGHALRLKRKMDNSGETPLSLCPRYLPPDPGPDMPYKIVNGKVSDTNYSMKLRFVARGGLFACWSFESELTRADRRNV